MKSSWAVLLGILALALALRVPCLRWGLPPAIPEVVASDLRCSYALDEDDILTPLSFTNPSRGDIAPRRYLWGTLHLELVLVALEVAERTGVFGHPWRAAYYQMVGSDFDRVYVVGRMVSVAMGLVLISAIFLAGRAYAGAEAGLWAALLAAVAPGHLLSSTQIRVDITMAALIVLVVWSGLEVQKRGKGAAAFGLGLASGLAITAKYTGALIALPVLAVTCWKRRRCLGACLAGIAAGVLIGEPFVLTRFAEISMEVEKAWTTNRQAPAGFEIPLPVLLARNASHTARFAWGLPAALLSLAGLIVMIRRRTSADALLLAGLGGVVASLVLMRWPLLRYELPLLPFLAVPAGAMLARYVVGWRWVLGIAVAAVSLAASAAQVHYMRSPHPANSMLALILQTVPPGSAIARLIPEAPPLDRKVYPLGPNSLLQDLTRDPPQWVLITDLPDNPYPPANRALLQERYAKIAEFRGDRIFPWATLGERGAPHDWKYTHASMVLYRRSSSHVP